MEFPTCSAAVAMDDPAAVLPAEPTRPDLENSLTGLVAWQQKYMKECCSSVAVNAVVDQLVHHAIVAAVLA